jgi:putative zinc finger/helix-turn-helix YgiT family protein
MTENHCANCGKGKIEFQSVKDFETKVRGVPFTVPEASVGICNSCGAKFYSPNEIRRWQQLFDAQQVAAGRLLSAEEISSIRQGLGLSVSSFALLLGTTRQSVYNWERRDRKSPQLGLVDLLLRLVRESAANGNVEVLHFLSEQSGVEITTATRSDRCTPPWRSRRRDSSRRRWCDPAQYDQAVGSTGPAKALPSLRSF